jgi:hypothetical protein
LIVLIVTRRGRVQTRGRAPARRRRSVIIFLAKEGFRPAIL